jgi:hypothetical protein
MTVGCCSLISESRHESRAVDLHQNEILEYMPCRSYLASHLKRKALQYAVVNSMEK